MKSLKDGFIEYLNEKYIEIVENDVSTYLKRKYSEEQEIKGIITALSALDSDLEEFQFKIKFEDNSGEIFILEYTCVLDNGIKDLKCITCSENKNGRFEYMNNLSSCFVPFMYRDKYDIFAKRFLDNCVGDEFKGYPVNVLGISSNMGLQMIYAYNIPSMGCTVFKDCKMNLRTADGILSLKSLKKGTIIISVGNILKTGNLSLSNSTVIHECIHWYYHRKAFEILMLLNDEYSYLECKDYDSTDAINKAFNFMEIQANALTPIILMDKDCVISELKEAMAMIENDKELNDLPRVNKFNRICSEVANTFQTSLNSTVKRLVSLGYEEFKVLENKNGVDDFIPTSSSDKLPENKTRCINKDQYRFLMKTNKTFSFLINNDICVYTNGYVVMNSKKYLDGEYPVQRLNVYARDHIDECSILFDIKTIYFENEICDFNHVGLNRGIADVIHGISMDRNSIMRIVGFIEETFSEEDKRDFFKTFNFSISKDTNFSSYLIKLIDEKNISNGQLAIRSGCNESTIKRYRQENNDSYSIEVVLAIACGLKCYPFQTYNLLSLAGFNIETSSKKNQIYKYLVTECYKDGIHKWNDYLAENGIPKLNNA